MGDITMAEIDVARELANAYLVVIRDLSTRDSPYFMDSTVKGTAIYLRCLYDRLLKDIDKLLKAWRAQGGDPKPGVRT